MAITLTEQAARHIKENIFKNDHQYLRFGIRESGCTGYRYVLEVTGDKKEDDHEFKLHGVNVVVDEKSLAVVDGTEIDYVKQDFSEMFAFNNPKVAAQCGCGESFSTTN